MSEKERIEECLKLLETELQTLGFIDENNIALKDFWLYDDAVFDIRIEVASEENIDEWPDDAFLDFGDVYYIAETEYELTSLDEYYLDELVDIDVYKKGELAWQKI